MIAGSGREDSLRLDSELHRTGAGDDGLRIEVSEQDVLPESIGPIEHSLRVLARLLLKSASAAQAEAPTDPENPLDVASASKVGLDSR